MKGFGWLGILVALASMAASRASAQSSTEWPMYGHDLGSTRFSPLSQINPGNVGTLAVAWSYKMRPGGAGPAGGAFSQVTPIVVHGVMYLPAGNRVLALEPETGKEIWAYQRPTGLVSARGVAYWSGDSDHPPRIFFTSGHKMVALNAQTGQPDPKFGEGGEITMDVPFAEVPTIYKNLIIVGANVYGPGEDQSPPAGRSRRRCARRRARLRRPHREEDLGFPRYRPAG